MTKHGVESPRMLTGGGEAGDLIRGFDWASTPLGAMDTWPRSLLFLVQTIVSSRQPMFLFWGPDSIQFYNDAYRPSFGEGKHPEAIGQRGQDCWEEIWPIIGPEIELVTSTGAATWHEDALVPIFRNGRIEDVYWTYGYSPAFDDDGEIAGVLVVTNETTQGVLATRRLKLAAKVVECTAAAASSGAVVDEALQCISEHPLDVPLACIFDSNAHMSHGAALSQDDAAVLRDALAELPASEPATTRSLSRPIIMDATGDSVSEVFIARLGTRRFLLFGLSSRLPFDADYRKFLLQLVESIHTTRDRAIAVATHRSSEVERRDLLMQAPVATALLFGPQHKFQLANPLYEEMVGRKVVGKTYLEAFPELAGTPIVAILDRSYHQGTPFAIDEMHVPLDHDGSGTLQDRYFSFNLQPIRDAAGEVYGMMAIAVDITSSIAARDTQAQAHSELMEAHGERAHLIEGLESANQAKDEFLAMLGHELRNPLAPIVSALEIIGMDSGGAFSREHELIGRQVEHVVRLVDDLLDVARITRGKVELKKEECEIEAVILRAIEMTESLVEERQQQLRVDIRGPIPWWGDAARLAQVVANLLTNAARYSDAGGEIRVAARQDGDEICISVADDGMGITPEMQKHIFDMFVQAKQRTDREQGGLGLGLALVKNLIELHSGRVSVFSAGEGQGSTFQVRLPMTAAPAEVTPAPPPQATEGKRVLVVDDNVDAAEMLCELLRRRGHVVEVAHDGKTALSLLDGLLPEVAVLDIGLPDMDGHQLARKIQEAVGTRPCRLIAVTGHGQSHDHERSRAAGFDAHLVKPISFADLVSAIAGAIARPRRVAGKQVFLGKSARYVPLIAVRTPRERIAKNSHSIRGRECHTDPVLCDRVWGGVQWT